MGQTSTPIRTAFLYHSEKALYKPHPFCGMEGRIEGVPGMS